MDAQVTGSTIHKELFQSTFANPSRRDHVYLMVKDAASNEVPEATWRELVVGIKPRAIAKNLRKQGYTTLRVFNKMEYNESRKVCSVHYNNLIDVAFQVAGYEREPHLVLAAKKLRPMIEALPPKKAITVLKNVFKTVHHGVDKKAVEEAVTA